MNDNILLHCHELSKSYQEGQFHNDVLRNINFTVYRGEMIAIIGSSGSGKSTLLYLLGGLDQPTSGEIIFEGQSLNVLTMAQRAKIRNQRLGFIYQFHHLLSDFTALENIAMPLLIGGYRKTYIYKTAEEMLSIIGLKDRGHHRPAELSGGERQRVAIARALVNNPALVLADELTGNLDQKNTDNIFKLISEINMSKGTTFLVVTHDRQLANKLHRQLEMRDGALINYKQ